MLSYIFIQREGDRETIAKFIQDFSKYSEAKLVDYYNQQQKLGFVGVHGQAQTIVALNIVFRKRFGKSPIKITENIIVELTEPIQLDGESWSYLNCN